MKHCLYLSICAGILLLTGCGLFSRETTTTRSGSSSVSKEVTDRVPPSIAKMWELSVPALPSDAQAPTKIKVNGDVSIEATGSVVLKGQETPVAPGSEHSERQMAEATGPSMSGPAPKEFSGEAPHVSLPNAGPSAGGGTFSIMGAVEKAVSGMGTIYVIGGIAVAVGLVVTLWLRQFTLGLAIAGAGVAMVAVATLFATYPWVSLIIVAILLGLAGWFIFGLRKSAVTQAGTQAALDAHQTTLGTIVKAIEALPAEVQTTVKGQISTVAAKDYATETVKDTVTATKRAEGVA
jgi:hypothetical protein